MLSEPTEISGNSFLELYINSLSTNVVEEAAKLLQESAQIFRELLIATPSNLADQLGYFISKNQTSKNLRMRNQLAGALNEMVDAFSFAKERVGQFEQYDGWKDLLVEACVEVGVLSELLDERGKKKLLLSSDVCNSVSSGK